MLTTLTPYDSTLRYRRSHTNYPLSGPELLGHGPKSSKGDHEEFGSELYHGKR